MGVMRTVGVTFTATLVCRETIQILHQTGRLSFVFQTDPFVLQAIELEMRCFLF